MYFEHYSFWFQKTQIYLMIHLLMFLFFFNKGLSNASIFQATEG